MKERLLAEDIKQQQYFEAVPAPSPEKDEGTREMFTLLPFIIGGGQNTERWYFEHISKITKYKFKVIPEYFGMESNYAMVFPQKIKKVLKDNVDVMIFCVFDWDTIHDSKTERMKYVEFGDQFETEIANGTVRICRNMPSIEYWFLLHFENYTGLLKNYRDISNRLAPFIKSCFPDPTINFTKLLKAEKHLKDSTWVQNLCNHGKLNKAIKQAENNIKAAIVAGDLDKQSYSFLYKAFKYYPNTL